MSNVKMCGIDVSRWQGIIDWHTVSKNVDFAIIKAGGSDKGFYKDPYFERNYVEANKYGLNVGAYYYVGSKCVSENDGVADAKRFIKILGDRTFSMPVYLDFEAPPAKNKSGNTAAAIGFCDTMEQAGYFTGIYGSDISGFKDRLNLPDIKRFTLWVARYGSAPSYVADYGMWQSTSKGKVAGVNTYVDIDYAFVDFPAIIVGKHFNNN